MIPGPPRDPVGDHDAIPDVPTRLGGRGSIAMALYGDLTYDSRVRKEASTLARAGYDVTVVCLASRSTLTDLPATVRVVVVPPETRVIPGSANPYLDRDRGRVAAARVRIGWLVAYVRGLRSWGRVAVERVGEVDVWHAHDLTGLAAIVPRLPRGSAVIYDSHELFLDTETALRLPAFGRRLLRAYERRLVSRTRGIVTVNREIATILGRRYRPARMTVVYNCPEPWVPPASPSPLIREAAAIPAGAKVVLYHGGLSGDRGIDNLMEAMLADDLHDVHLVLMGYGEKRDDFVAAAQSERWGGRIHVLDPVPPSELLSWVASADLGAMPNPGITRNDVFSSPNKLFECLAAGIPVVAGDYPTMRRVIIENEGGVLGAVCDPMRVESIADAIRSIVRASPAEVEALKARCRRAAAERWNWDLEGGKLLALYAEILPSAPEQGRQGAGW